MSIFNLPDIYYHYIDIRSIKILSQKTESGRTIITDLYVDGKKLEYTNRFATSLCSLYGISKSIFNLYEPDEVIARIYERKVDNREIRLTTYQNQALAVTNIEKPIISSTDLETILSETNAISWDYSEDGIITSQHDIRVGDNKCIINNDEFINRFVVNTPIDGYGLPTSYISAYRIVCSNLMIAKAKLFKSSIKLGNKIDTNIPQMIQFIESFNNEKAYEAVQSRLKSAMRSPASLDEIYRLSSILDDEKFATIHTNAKYAKNDTNIIIDSDQLRALRKLSGDEADRYGLISLASLDKKRRQKLSSNTTVYNLLNYASELATHYATENKQRQILYAWIGDMIGNEYDLEGILDKDEEPIDLFLSINQN